MRWIEEIRNDIASVNSSLKELKKFGILIGIILFLTSIVSMWNEWWPSCLIYIVGLCGISLVTVGILRPERLKNLHRYWMSLAVILGSIISRIILFMLYYLVLTPIALIAKLFRKRFIILDWHTKRTSYWIDRENKNANYERMS